MYGLLSLVLAVSTLAAARPSNVNELKPKRQVSSCGTTSFQNRFGFVKTPNYPSNYDNNMDCVYNIRPGNLSFFRVDFYACDCNIENNVFCRYDYIRFGQGSKYCGNQTAGSYSAFSSNSTVDVTFHTDGSISRSGCQIAYGLYSSASELKAMCPGQQNSSSSWTTQTDWTTQSSNWTSASSNRSSNCGTTRQLEGGYGFVSTPNYPSNYDNDLDCLYSINSSSVNFYACDCNTEQHSTCDYDYIRFGRSGSDRCGTITGRSYSVSDSRGTVDVVFHSDYSATRKGCLISYGIGANSSTLRSMCPEQPSVNVNASSSNSSSSSSSSNSSSCNSSNNQNCTILVTS